MGERKVLNKYYPPDFDPSLIPKGKRPKNDQVKVRMMMPMSVRCATCGEYIYKGKKFNSRKETVAGEEYLGIKIFRFYVKCPRCAAELSIKTDPKNADYVCEFGASRNFEPWRDKEKQIEEAKEQRKQEEEGDAMKALENRTLDSKIEMDILDALDEIRSINSRNSRLELDQIIESKISQNEKRANMLSEEDEALVRSVFGKSDNVKRLDEDDDAKDELLGTAATKEIKSETLLIKEEKKANPSPTINNNNKRKTGPVLPIICVVPKGQQAKKPKIEATTSEQKVAASANNDNDDGEGGGGLSLVDY